MLFEVPPSSLAHTKPGSKPLKHGSSALCQQFSSSWCSCKGLGGVFIYFLPRETLCTACLHLFYPINCQWEKGESLPYLFICVVGTVTTDHSPFISRYSPRTEILGEIPCAFPSLWVRPVATAHSSTSLHPVSSCYIKPFKVSEKKSILRVCGFIQLITW